MASLIERLEWHLFRMSSKSKSLSVLLMRHQNNAKERKKHVQERKGESSSAITNIVVETGKILVDYRQTETQLKIKISKERNFLQFS